MDKEIIDLLKTLAGNTETLVICYMVLHFISNILSWIGGVACMYWFGCGILYAAVVGDRASAELGGKPNG